MAGTATVVVVVHGISDELEAVLRLVSDTARTVSENVSIVLVDCGDEDLGGDAERILAAVPDVQYIGLIGAENDDVACLAGMEHAPPSDVVVLFDPTLDDPTLLPAMICSVREGADLVVVSRLSSGGGFMYGLLRGAFVSLFRLVGGIDVRAGASRFRAMSARVTSHVTRHDEAAIGHRVIPFMSGFRRIELRQEGPAPMSPRSPSSTMDGVRKALGMVVSSSTAPLRMTSTLCILSAFASLIFSSYVVMTYLLDEGVAPGWTTLSLQMNAMFFLLSLALAVMSEYVLLLRKGGRPPYHVARSLHSPVMTALTRLNLDEGKSG